MCLSENRLVMVDHGAFRRIFRRNERFILPVAMHFKDLYKQPSSCVCKYEF